MLAGSAGQLPTRIDELLPRELAAQLDRLDLISRRILNGRLPGERRSKRRGRSVEFDDFREYSSGDDLRHIDWNVYARLDRLFIKLFREEEDLSLHLIVDCSASMDAGNPNKLVWAHQVAMATGYIGLVNQNRVAATMVGVPTESGVIRLAPMRGRTSLSRLGATLLQSLEQSVRQKSAAGPTFSQAIKKAGLSHIDRGVVLVLSDFLTEDGTVGDLLPGMNLLSALAAKGADIYCMQTLSPGEIDPSIERPRGLLGDLRLLSAESAKATEVTVTPGLITRYQNRLGAYQIALKSLCNSKGLNWMAARTDIKVADLVLQTLRRGGVLG